MFRTRTVRVEVLVNPAGAGLLCEPPAPADPDGLSTRCEKQHGHGRLHPEGLEETHIPIENCPSVAYTAAQDAVRPCGV